MSEQQIFILVTVLVAIVIIGLFVFMLLRKRRSGEEQNGVVRPLTSAAFICVIIGITFGDSRWVGYGFIGLGMVLAIIDMVIQLRERN